MATVSFYSQLSQIVAMAGSGLGFYGSSGFGASVSVGDWQAKTYVTDSAGTTLGVETSNSQYDTSTTVKIAGATSGVALGCLPNPQVPLFIEFTHDSAVQVQSATLTAYDRSNPNNDPSGALFRAAEIIHPTLTQVNNGSGDTTWTLISGSGSKLTLANSPGVSGFYAGNGTNSTRPDLTHRWHVALSASPSSVGSKLAAAYFACEFF